MHLAVLLATALSASVVAPSLPDTATVLSARGQTLLTENESNGPTRFGHDSAQLAEANLPSPGGRDAAA